MSVGNMKIDGWAQGLYEISATKKERLGALRITDDGRKYRYCKAGASALVPGKMAAAPVVDLDFFDKAGIAAAIGATELTVTIVNPAAAYAEDYFSDGSLVVRDKWRKYAIEGSQAIAATVQTTVRLNLREPLHEAITTSEETALVPSPYMAAVQNATDEMLPIGIPEVNVTAAYYFWAQTGGIGHCLVKGTPTVGTMLIPSATTGALQGIAYSGGSTYDPDVPYCAIAWGGSSDSDASIVKLILD